MKSNALIKIATSNMQVKNLYEAFVNFEKAIEIDENNEDIYCHRAQVSVK
jgi:Tfp pilus assembly protein PilF